MVPDVRWLSALSAGALVAALSALACTRLPAKSGPDFELADAEPSEPAPDDGDDIDIDPGGPGEEAPDASSPDDGGPPADGCASSCKYVNARRCVGDSDDYETCTEVGPGCLQWKAPTSCGSGKECTGAGTCSSTTNKSIGSPCTGNAECASNKCSQCPYYGSGLCCVP